MSTSQTILTGDRPTGQLHLGQALLNKSDFG